MFTDTGKGYCVDEHGRKHYSIHPRVRSNGKKSDTSAPRRRSKGHLAKAEARRLERRKANGTYNSGNKFADHMAGSMKWK